MEDLLKDTQPGPTDSEGFDLLAGTNHATTNFSLQDNDNFEEQPLDDGDELGFQPKFVDPLHATDPIGDLVPPSSRAAPAVTATASTTGAAANSSKHNWFEDEMLVLPRSFMESPVKVWVSEPRNETSISSLGMKTTYVSYLVHTESQLASIVADGLDVRRRFSEFDALHKILRNEYKGFFIPPLPDKAPLETYTGGPEFITHRRVDLQAFLRGICCHAVLRQSEGVHMFLTTPGELSHNPQWQQLQKQVSIYDSLKVLMGTGPVTIPTTEDSDTKGMAPNINPSWMSWMKQSIVPPKRLMSEDENYLRNMKELLEDLERLLQLSSDSARVLCQHMSAMSGDYAEMSRNFAMLMRFEEVVQMKSGQYTELGQQAEKRSGDFGRAALINKKMHSVWEACSIKNAAALVALHDYHLLIPEAVAALEERENLLATIWMLEEDLTSLQQQLLQAHAGSSAVSFGTFTNRDKRLSQLNTMIQVTEEKLKAAKEVYETVKERNQSELARLSLTRHEDFKNMMSSFCQLNAQVALAAAELWNTTAQEYSG